MKLILCGKCHDVVRLISERRTCLCGKSAGKYLEDDHTAIYSGPALPLGIANPDVMYGGVQWAAEGQPEIPIRCWFMRGDYEKFRKVDRVE